MCGKIQVLAHRAFGSSLRKGIALARALIAPSGVPNHRALADSACQNPDSDSPFNGITPADGRYAIMLCARSGRMRRTGAFRMGPGTVERLPLRRPRAVPERCGLPPMHAFVNHFSAHRSDLVDKSVHERKCGTGSRKERDGDAARWRSSTGKHPRAFPRRRPPRSRVPRADGEAAGACRIGRGGNLGPARKKRSGGHCASKGDSKLRFCRT